MGFCVRTTEGVEVAGVVHEKGREPYAEMTQQQAEADAAERNARAEGMDIKARYAAVEL